LGGLLSGLDTALIAITTQQLTSFYPWTRGMVLGVVEQRVGLRDPVRIMANFYTV
jgi:hypothetical protein